MFIESYPNEQYSFRFYLNTRKLTWQQIKAEEGCHSLINLSYYNQAAYGKAKTRQEVVASLDSALVIDGETLCPVVYKEWGLCIDAEGRLTRGLGAGQSNYTIGLPPAYIDGQKYNSRYFMGKNGCTYVGIKKDGAPVLMLASRDNGKTSDEANAALLNAGCVDILRFDGSWSSQGALGDKICAPSQTRIVATYLLVFERDPKIKNANLKFNGNFTVRSTTTHLVLHHASANGSVKTIHNAHQSRGWFGIGYHYYVRKDGTVWRGRPENAVGSHAGGGSPAHNFNSLSICFEGNFEVETMPDKQIEAGKWLIEDIKARYPGIVVNKHKDNIATACPGKNFPLDKLTSTEPPPFADIAGHWAEKDILACYEAGIISKVENFRPNDPMTRAEVATIIARLIGKVGA